MISESVEKLVKQLSSSLPEGVQAVRDDIESGFRSVLNHSFDRLDIVTREEYEVQAQVLAKTREKLEALEKRLNELEHSAQEK